MADDRRRKVQTVKYIDSKSRSVKDSKIYIKKIGVLLGNVTLVADSYIVTSVPHQNI